MSEQRPPLSLGHEPIGEGSVLGGRYRLDRLVGLGGFARVFLATDLTLKRLVALKVLNADLTEDEDFLGRFAREAQAVAALDHPNILGIHDYGQVGATAYLVMPYVEGGTLHDRLRAGGSLPLAQAAEWLRQAAAALDYAHRRSLVHRDVKPQNMLLRDDGERLLLTDFGIAKVLSATSAQSKTGVMGTLSYMAPEQFRGEVGRATDIYALGCVAFQLATGQLPFTGPTEQVMYGHLAGAIPSLAERARGQVPPQLQAVIDRALAKDPAERHPSATDLARDFAAAIAGGGAAAMRRGDEPTALVPSPTPAALPSEAPTRPLPASLPPQAMPDERTQLAGAPPGAAAAPPPIPYPVIPVAAATGPAPGRAGRRAFIAGAAALGLGAVAVGGLVATRRQGGDAATATTAPGTVAPTAVVAAAATAPATGTAAPAAILPTPTATVVPTVTPYPTSTTPAILLAETVTTLTGHGDAVNCLAWSPDGTLLASGSRDQTVRLWGADGQQRATVGEKYDVVYALAWSPNGQTLAVGYRDNLIRLWRRDGTAVGTLKGHQGVVQCLAWSPDSSRLLSGGKSPNSLWLWDVAAQTGMPLDTFFPYGFSSDVNDVAWSPNGAVIAAAFTSSLDIGSPADKVKGTEVENAARLAWSPDGKYMVVDTENEKVELRSADGRTLLATYRNPDQTTKVGGLLAWSPNSALVAVTAGNDVRLWTPDGTPRANLAGHTGKVTGLAWSPDSKLLASSSEDKTVRVWRAP